MNKFITSFFMIFLGTASLFAQNTKLDTIIKNNELRVCIWPQYYGISYIDKRTQSLKGIDSDLAIELAKQGLLYDEEKLSDDAMMNGDLSEDDEDKAGLTVAQAKKMFESVLERFNPRVYTADPTADELKSDEEVFNKNSKGGDITKEFEKAAKRSGSRWDKHLHTPETGWYRGTVKFVMRYLLNNTGFNTNKDGEKASQIATHLLHNYKKSPLFINESVNEAKLTEKNVKVGDYVIALVGDMKLDYDLYDITNDVDGSPMKKGDEFEIARFVKDDEAVILQGDLNDNDAEYSLHVSDLQHFKKK
jgi:hypothetical protein